MNIDNYDISTREPDNSSIIGGVIITFLFSSISVIIGMIGFLSYIFDDITTIPLILGLLFFSIPFFLMYLLVNKLSIHRLIIKYDDDVLVLQKLLQGKCWSVKQNTLSESLYLSHYYYTITSAPMGGDTGDTYVSVEDRTDGTTSSKINKYHIHGSSETKGGWKLEISRIIQDFDDDKAREIAKYIGIEFRDEGEVRPKGLVIG